jgi:hypothetical protein
VYYINKSRSHLKKESALFGGPHGATKHVYATQSYKQQFLRRMGFTLSSTYYTQSLRRFMAKGLFMCANKDKNKNVPMFAVSTQIFLIFKIVKVREIWSEFKKKTVIR